MPLEKEMSIHSSVLAWEIPWTEEPGQQQSMGVTKESYTTQGLNNKKQILQFTTKCNTCSIRAGDSVQLTAVPPASRRAPDTE